MLIFSILLFVASFSADVHAICPNLAINNLPAVISLNSNINPQINFQVTRTDKSTSCDYRVGITRGSSPSYDRKLFNNANTLDFALSKKSSMNPSIKDIYDANNKNEYISGKFKPKNNNNQNTENHKFYAELTLNNFAHAGTYTDTFEVKLYDSFSGTYFLKASYPITFEYHIDNQVDLSIVSTGQSYDPVSTQQSLNFGTLNQGATQNLDVVIQANSGYILSISSANNGKLKHNNSNNFINYLMRANGQLQDLTNSNSSPEVISDDFGVHPNDGFRVPLSFEIQGVSNKPSGNYLDTLVLTVTSNL